MKTRTTVLFLAVLMAMTSTVSAAQVNDTESSTVDVTVAAETKLDVKPDAMTFSGLSVGTQTPTSDSGFGSLKVENTGSEDIASVWFNTTNPASNPFGTGTSTDHDSGNLLKIKPNNAGASSALYGNDTTYHYVTRAEFFENDMPLLTTGTDWNALTIPESDMYTGRIRFGGDEFNFVIGSDGGTCNGAGQAVLRVGDTPSTETQLGTVDFSDSGTDYTEYAVDQVNTGAGYGISNTTVKFSMSDGNSYEDYDLLTSCDDTGINGFSEAHVLLNRFNIEAGGADNLFNADGTESEQMYRSTTDGNDLNPGGHFTVDVAVQVPRGVPTGSLSQGTLSVLATTSTNN